MEDCLFCQIVVGDVPSSRRFEDDQVVAFDDIHPKAPIHILVIPKQHIDSLNHAQEQDQPLLGHLLLSTATIAKELGLSGYKVRINTGRSGGQVIDHLHVHLLASDPSRQDVGLEGTVLETEV